MNLEDAKRVADILQKIDKNNEIINNLKFKKTHDIRFGKGNNESTFIVCLTFLNVSCNVLLFLLLSS